MIKTISLLSLIAAFALSASAEVVKYSIDPVHSGINFKVRHLINKMPGSFDSFSGEIHFDKDNPANSKAIAMIEVASVDTRNKKRDNHLQSGDFFTAETYPLIQFESTEWTPAGENKYSVKGILTMVGIAREVVLDVTFLGEMQGLKGMVSGWEGITSISRSDWGITYGGATIGETVDIELNIQAGRQ